MIFTHENAELAINYIGRTVTNVEDKRKYILEGIKIVSNEENVFYINHGWTTTIEVPDTDNTIPIVTYNEIYDNNNHNIAKHLIGHLVLFNNSKDYIRMGHGFIGILKNIDDFHSNSYMDLDNEHYLYVRKIIIRSAERDEKSCIKKETKSTKEENLMLENLSDIIKMKMMMKMIDGGKGNFDMNSLMKISIINSLMDTDGKSNSKFAITDIIKTQLMMKFAISNDELESPSEDLPIVKLMVIDMLNKGEFDPTELVKYKFMESLLNDDSKPKEPKKDK